MNEYYSITIDITGEDDVDRVSKLARSMDSFYRMYIDEKLTDVWGDEDSYNAEILFADEKDATMFRLKL